MLRDAHIHLAEHGRERSWLAVGDCTDREMCLDRIASAAAELPADGWLTASGLRTEAWSDPTPPDADALHEATDGRRVTLHSFDHHAMVVSRRVLELAGINDATPDPEGGFIVRRGGEATGLLLESACDFVRAVTPEATVNDRKAWIREAQQELRALDIAEVHDMHAIPDFARALLELEAEDALELDVHLYVPPWAFDEVRTIMAAAVDSKRVHLSGIKLFTDGTLNSRTAHMLHPFAHPIESHPRGTPLLSDDEIRSTFARAAEAGVEVATHAIGDGAVRRLLDLHERFDGTVRLRVEHAQFIDEADIPRFPRQGVIASMQPCHLLTDIEAIRRLTPDRAHRAFPLRDLVDACSEAGVAPESVLMLGSDAPIVSPDPADNLQAAVERRRSGMPASEAVALEQGLEQDMVVHLSKF